MRRWLAPTLVIALVLVVPSAGAEMAGDCRATLDGIDIEDRDADDADDAIALPAHQPATFDVESERPLESWNISIHYGPFEAPLSRGEAPGNATTAQAQIPVNDFAWLGSGLYQVQGTVEMEDGSTCEGEALVDIQGDLLGTVLGTTSLAVAGLGGLGLLAEARSGYQDAYEEAPELRREDSGEE